MHFIWLWKVIYIYIYILYRERERYNYIYIYIYHIWYTGNSWDIFSSKSTMFTSLPPRRFRWSAGAAGRSSSSSFKERNFSHSPEFWVRVALPGRRRICGPSFSLDILRLQRLEAYGPGLLRAGPSGEERCTLHHTVPVSSQCHQEIGLPTLPVFQGAAVSSEHFTQSLPPRNVAEPGGLPPFGGL